MGKYKALHLKLLVPKALNIVLLNGRSSGFPQLIAAFPSRGLGTVAKVAFNMKGLQLRVQLRNYTGFPIILTFENHLQVKVHLFFYRKRKSEGLISTRNESINIPCCE